MVRRSRTPSGHAAAGFTLLDLMLVVVILAIVTAVAVQTVDTRENQLDATARAIAADLYEARSLAIQTRVPFGLLFEPAQNRARFVLADGTTPATSEVILRLTSGLAGDDVDRLLAARASGHDGFGAVTLAAADFAGGPRLVFAADGTPKAGGTVDVVLDAWKLRVRVQDVTGRIVITTP